MRKFIPEVNIMSKFIVLEGLDGSGKGTQILYLREFLERAGKRVRVIDFPSYGSAGAALVELYLRGELGEHPDDTNAYAASMFFAADRYVSYVTQWRADYLNSDTYLIANRYTTANAYHQISKLPREQWDGFLTWLWDFEFEKLGLPSPDRVILLDMPDTVSDAMVQKRSEETGAKLDIHEKDVGYLHRCREAAMYVADKCGWTVVKCADDDGTEPYSRKKIAEKIRAVVADLM